MNWYLKVLKQFADFNGRARRKEYWMFVLFYCIFMVVATMIDGGLGINIGPSPYGYITVAYLLAMIVPSIAVAVRRLHDVGKSGWFILVCLIPVIGSIWLLVLLAKEGDAVDNQYGPNPKGTNALA
ncbi:DUF805 domain-containing protein [Flavobacterium sp.]|uniref:DUF805 domain-containing protein n=1 Tax=Flavobacterium sp. TaxID=239 RepID=UPI0039E30B80